MAAPSLAGSFLLPEACWPLVARIDDELRRFLAEARGRAADPGLDVVFGELERITASGGKRLRPLFCLLGHLAAGGSATGEAIRAASALELLHTFAIVHDDLMDRSETRRGAPASWRHLAAEHGRAGFRGDPANYGAAGAILAGDLALVLADEALLESGFSPERILPALRRYQRMRTEVVSGQFLDVLAASRGEVGEREARRIAVLKSGQYTVQGPLLIGATLAGAEESLLGPLSGYGLPLGEAFQIRDDILGVFGDPAETGKDRDSDLREGKRTVLLAKAVDAAGPEDRAFLQERVGVPDPTPAELDRIRAIIEDTGALEATLRLVEDLRARAAGALEAAAVPGDVGEILREMAEAVTARRA